MKEIGIEKMSYKLRVGKVGETGWGEDVRYKVLTI